VKSLRIDLILLLAVLALVGFGLVIIYSSSAAYAEARNLPDSFYLVHHMKKVLIGFAAFLIGLSVPYKSWEKASRPIMFACLGLLAFVVCSGMVGSVNGARRWVFGIQPSELAKIALILSLARILAEKADVMDSFGKGLLASLVLSGITFLLILKQPNYSTAATVMAITVALVFAGGARIRHLALLAAIGLPALGVLMVSSAYRLKRVMAFLHPEDNPASSYQSLQALVSLGNGGLFGTGLGTSTQKLGYLPMPFTDTIFSILGEELGLFGTALCLALFAVVIWRGLRIAFFCPDRFGSLVALGTVVSLGVNVIMHVGVCAKFFPTTGQPLPFLSYGGTSLVVGLFAMGILLNISGHSLETMPESWRANPRKWQMLAGAAAKAAGPKARTGSPSGAPAVATAVGRASAKEAAAPKAKSRATQASGRSDSRRPAPALRAYPGGR
jgi:cell division protein FtsW